MRAARLQFHAQIGMAPEAFQHPIVRDRRPAGDADGHPQPVTAVPSDGLIDGPAPRHDADAGGDIFTRHRWFAPPATAAERGFAPPGCAPPPSKPLVSLVQPVNPTPRAGSAANFGSSPSKGVLQGYARGFPRARMHYQTGGFVDDQHVRIFVDPAQGDGLRQYLRLRRLIRRYLHPDTGSRRHHIPRFAGRPIHSDGALLDPPLDSRARMLRHQPRQRTIQPLPGHFRRNLQFDHLELWGHRALEASGEASGILPRFRHPPIVRNRL